jgi:hypothetical protein
MRVLSVLLSGLLLPHTVPSGRGLQLGRNHHGLVRNSMNQRRPNRLRANPTDDSSDLQTVVQNSRFPLLSSGLPQLTFQISVGMFLLSAPLGMLLDNYHGKC